ncbi:response regulator [Marivirga lumbricoides]|uniref:Response regulator n=1 Tax=Marivirga lumbricoides TaxID=1046115 RepID=A0ABQ1MGX7_9BACT|nr:response regulator [Marivirga lumbricoides]
MEAFIVDDDELTVFLHEVFVKESNFHHNPHTFYHGKSTLDYLLSHFNPKEKYCIFLDLNMPIMDGWEFLDAIKNKEISDNIMVVVLTSSINEVDRRKAKKYHQVIDYMEKPLNGRKLESLKKNNHLTPFF